MSHRPSQGVRGAGASAGGDSPRVTQAQPEGEGSWSQHGRGFILGCWEGEAWGRGTSAGLTWDTVFEPSCPLCSDILPWCAQWGDGGVDR